MLSSQHRPNKNDNVDPIMILPQISDIQHWPIVGQHVGRKKANSAVRWWINVVLLILAQESWLYCPNVGRTASCYLGRNDRFWWNDLTRHSLKSTVFTSSLYWNCYHYISRCTPATKYIVYVKDIINFKTPIILTSRDRAPGSTFLNPSLYYFFLFHIDIIVNFT